MPKKPKDQPISSKTAATINMDGTAIMQGLDRLIDMLRTVVNVTGNAMVTAVVAKSEGKLDLSVFNDPNAGAIYDDELDIAPAAEARLADAIHDAEAAVHKLGLMS